MERARLRGEPDAVAKPTLVFFPEDPAARKSTIHIRVLGAVTDGRVTVYPSGKKGVKQVASSPSFGSKNRTELVVDPDKPDAKPVEVVHPGIFDWPPLRLNPGSYTAILTGGDKRLAQESFVITGEEAPDLSVQDPGGPTQAQRTVIQNQHTDLAFARQTALASGSKLPDPLSEEDILGTLVGSADTKK